VETSRVRQPGVNMLARRKRLFGVALCAASTVAIAAWRGGHDVKINGAKVEDAQFVKRDSTRPLGPGDIRIASQDSAMEIALIGDSLVAGLGSRVREKVHNDLDTSQVSGSGFSASIEKMVKSTVAS